jgi:site-specific DNA-methyltransferase (adenine-specific)
MGWDDKVPEKIYFDEMLRVSKNQIIWGGNYFNGYLPASKGWIIWDKGQYGLTMADCELCFTSYDKPTRIFQHNRCELKKDNSQHPTQKPEILIKKCIIFSGIEKEALVLDPFGGSGTTAIAALELGMRFIVIEKEPKYCEIANRRVQEWQRQLKLW